jgi:DNA-binding transcriptional regulator LsrR (DeoR family)
MTAKSGTTHPHRTFTNDPRNVEEAAWWIAMEGKTDAEVADIMQCPVRHIATMRRNAWARGLIFGFDRTRVTDKAHLRYLDSIGLQGRLERHLRTAHRNFRELKIFDSGSEGQSPHDILQRLQQFSNNAGPWLKTLLKRASTVGVSWGLTLRLAVAELAKVDVGKPSRAIEVVPTCGELLGTSAGDTSSSSIAAQLAAAMNAHGKHSLSLAGTPAMIAQRFQASGNLAVIQEFLKESPAYTAIFINRPKGARPC